MAKLAIDGGKPVRPQPLSGGFHGSAEIDQREIDAVLSVLQRKRLFRFLAPEELSEAAQLEAWYAQRLGRKYCLAV
ncbi:MAG: glutamine--scyllo-inositol aminotransferase, partial [Chloroflexi bacterium]|nr:glutamine--scyllo-inositol aminotransferase [Chloroflexota bacterium]